MFIYLLNMSFHNILYMIFNFIEKKLKNYYKLYSKVKEMYAKL